MGAIKGNTLTAESIWVIYMCLHRCDGETFAFLHYGRCVLFSYRYVALAESLKVINYRWLQKIPPFNLNNAKSIKSCNPLTLRAAKRGLTILKEFQFQKHVLENI